MAKLNGCKSSDKPKNPITEFHEHSNRSVIECELNLPHAEIVGLLGMQEKIRKAKNDTLHIMMKRLGQLRRTKKNRKLREDYGACKEKLKRNPDDAEPEKERKRFGQELKAMNEKYGLTLSECFKVMQKFQAKYKINSAFSVPAARDVWQALEKVLYGNGKKIHFAKRGDLPAIKAKERKRGIVIKLETIGKEDRLCFWMDGKKYTLKRGDAFQEETFAAIVQYLKNADAIDRDAADEYAKTGRVVDTFRPCYAIFLVRRMRGKNRAFAQIMIEANPLPKKRHEKHPFATSGIVGCDIGTQTAAWTSDSEVGLINLGERGNKTEELDLRIRELDRSMDRSRRVMNPENYNPNGTIKRGKKTWRYSKHYLKMREERKELHRLLALNREYANNETANHLRRLGNTLVTEPKNASKLAKKAKKPKNGSVKLDKNGRPAKRKRYGRSIQQRAPGGLHARLKQIFGPRYIEVGEWTYRASQFDHTGGIYLKKKLNDRIVPLSSGDVVQRDWYSSFLLYHYGLDGQIDREACLADFPGKFAMQNAMIERIAKGGKHIFNSGIKVEFPDGKKIRGRRGSWMYFRILEIAKWRKAKEKRLSAALSVANDSDAVAPQKSSKSKNKRTPKRGSPKAVA